MKKLVIWIFGLILLSSLAFAFSTDPADYIGYDDGTATIDNGTNSLDDDLLTDHGWTNSPVNPTNFGLQYDNDQTNNLGNFSIMNPAGNSEDVVDLDVHDSNNISFQISFYDVGGTGSDNFKIMTRVSYEHQLGIFEDQPNGDSNYYGYDAGFYDTGVARTVGWHNMTISHTGGHVYHYIDNIQVRDSTSNLNGELFTIYYNGFVAEISIDNILIWEGGINDIPQVPTPPVGGQYNVTLVSPPNDVAYNQTTQINFTYTPFINWTDGVCQLWTNETGLWQLEETSDNKDAGNSNYTVNQNSSFLHNISVEQTYFIWGVRCDDGLITPDINWSFENRTVLYDIISPNLNTNFLNTSIFLERITGQFNFSDPDLYSTYIAVDGLQIHNITDHNTTAYTYDLNYSISNLSGGSHILTTRVADGHTAQYIGNYDVDYGLWGNDIVFNTPYNQRVEITALGGSIFDDWDTNKKLDRYTFDYIPSDKSKSKYDFIVTSDHYIDIVTNPDSKWGSWLITGNHWLDFYSPDIDKSKIVYTRIDDYNVLVEVKEKVKDGKLSFESIGELNILEINYTFYKALVTFTFDPENVENQNTVIGATINKSGNITDTNVVITYNNTLLSVTKTVGSPADVFNATTVSPVVPSNSKKIPLSYNVTLISPLNNVSQIYYFNQTVFKILIDNCSTYNTTAITFNLYEDINKAAINGTLKGYFKFWEASESQAALYNITWAENTTFGLCMFPDYASYKVYAQMEYETSQSDYVTETYYLYNTTINNDTDIVNLYLTPNTTQVLFTVTDENDEYVTDAYINVLKYDFPTNSYVTSEIIKTDEAGEAIGNIRTLTDWYKFFIFNNGVLVFESEPVKIITTEKNFRVNLQSSFFNNYNIIRGVVTSLTYNNATKTYTYDFTNPTGTSLTGCLKVTRQTILDDIDLNETCVTASSGTISIAINEEVADNTYIGTGYLDLNPILVTDLLPQSFKEAYKQLGQNALFLSFIVKLGIVMIGIWNPLVAIVLILAADFSLMLMGLYVMSTPVFMIYLIIGLVTLWRIKQG